MRYLTKFGAMCMGVCLAFVLAACGGDSSGDALTEAEQQAQDVEDAMGGIGGDGSDGFRDESGNQTATGGDQVEMPPNWPSELALPDGFILDNTSWADDGSEQTVVGSLEGMDRDAAFDVIQPWVESAGFTGIEVQEFENPTPTKSLHAQGDGARISIEVRNSVIDPATNLIVIIVTAT